MRVSSNTVEQQVYLGFLLMKVGRKPIDKERTMTMQTAEQLFTRWLELSKITDGLEPKIPAFDKAYDEMTAIEGRLHEDHHKVVGWDRGNRRYRLVEAED